MSLSTEKILLYEIREEIAKLAEPDRIRVEAIAVTMRNILGSDPHASMALALVGAEQAAIE